MITAGKRITIRKIQITIIYSISFGNTIVHGFSFRNAMADIFDTRQKKKRKSLLYPLNY
jgi:hypothetical protein